MNSFAAWYISARKTFRARVCGAGPAQGRDSTPLAAEGEQVPGQVLWNDNSAADSLVRNSRCPTPTHVAQTYGHTRLKISSVPVGFAASTMRSGRVATLGECHGESERGAFVNGEFVGAAARFWMKACPVITTCVVR